MNGLSQDLRFAVRQLAKSPSFAIVATLSLALGIGATTAVFSVIHGILIDPYPYKDNQRMVHPVLYNEKGEVTFLFVNGPELEQVRQAPAVDEAFAIRNGNDSAIMTGNDFPIPVQADDYTPNTFQYFGVPPLLGREFTPADAPGGKPDPVVVLSYLFWKRQFGGSRDVLGKSIELDHQKYTVIGVVPPRFTWNDSDIYRMGVPTNNPKEYWSVFMKLKPGASVAAANAQLQPIVDEVAADPTLPFLKGVRIQLKGLNEYLVGQFKGTLLMLFCAVGLLLAVACANVSILLLARGSARAHELAVRRSLGAQRSRIVRQLLTESLLLSLVGTAIGIGLAFGGIRVITAFLPEHSFPHEAAIGINGPVLAFSVFVSLLVGVLFGIAPALQLSRSQIGSLLQSAGSRTSTARQGRFTRRALVMSQVTITVLLLAGAGAAMRGFVNLLHENLGFNPDHLLNMGLQLPKNTFPNWQARVNAFEAARAAIASTPGVESVGEAQAFFPPFNAASTEFDILGQTTPQKGTASLVAPQTFTALQMPLLQGRTFTQAETLNGSHFAVISQSFARKFFPNGDAVGHSVRAKLFSTIDFPGMVKQANIADWFQIVGVVGDVHNKGVAEAPDPAVFFPVTVLMGEGEGMWVRTERNPDAMIDAIRTSVRKQSANAFVTDPHSMSYWLDSRGWGKERFITLLFAAFSGLALLLAAAGLYSVTSYGVSLRTQEFAVRVALGAHRAHLLRLALASEAAAVLSGLFAGIVLSLSLGKVLRTWAGGSSRDPLILLAVAGLLAVVATIAAMLPAKRAAGVDPMKALRAE